MQTAHPENKAQERQSFWSVINAFGRIIKSTWGGPTWASLTSVAQMLFVGWMVHNYTAAKTLAESTTIWREKYQQQAIMTYKATTENRCLGLTILFILKPEEHPLPDWCVPIMAKMSHEPPPPETVNPAIGLETKP